MAGEGSIAENREEAEALSEVMGDLERRSERFGAALTSALQAATTGGKGLDDVLRGLGQRLSGIALSAGLKPFEAMIGNAVGGLLTAAARSSLSPMAGCRGAASRLSPRVVSSPARRFFPWAAGLA